MSTGTVRWFNSEKRYGFITAEDGKDIFVHATALSDGIRNLEPNQKVSFSVCDGERGPQAKDVTIID